MVLFGLGSLLCSMSQNITHLVIARVIQGIGGSLMIPVGKLALIKTFEKIIDIISSDDQTRSQLICNSVKELNEKIEKQSKKVEEEINNIISQLKQ